MSCQNPQYRQLVVNDEPILETVYKTDTGYRVIWAGSYGKRTVNSDTAEQAVNELKRQFGVSGQTLTVLFPAP